MAQRATSPSISHNTRPTPVSLAGDTLVFVARSILRLPRGLIWLLRHCYTALANDKSFFGWIASIAFGAFPPFFWTFCFKHAQLIPTQWRPKIHTDLLPVAERFFMSPLGAIVFTIILSPIALYMWQKAEGAPFPPLRTPETADASRSNTRYIPLQTSATSSEDGESLDPSVAARKEIYANTLSAADTRPAQSPLDGEHPEAASFLKVYALLVLAYPTLLYIMHLLAFTEVRAYKDLMAWATYGALHFASPIIIAWWLWFFAPPGGARTYGWCLGTQNIAGLFTHIIFPNAAPWFYDIYGDSLHPDPPPDYQTPGSAAGLVRVDVILGTHLYASGFKKSPVVFGAFPSLHAGTAVMSAYFVLRYSRRKGLAVMLIYAYWMFWSTMYFHHHYAVDLIGGTFWSSVTFVAALRLGVFSRFESRHAQEMTTIGWDRTFLGGGFFGTSLGRKWGSGHWDVQHRGLPT